MSPFPIRSRTLRCFLFRAATKRDARSLLQQAVGLVAAIPRLARGPRSSSLLYRFTQNALDRGMFAAMTVAMGGPEGVGARAPKLEGPVWCWAMECVDRSFSQTGMSVPKPAGPPTTQVRAHLRQSLFRVKEQGSNVRSSMGITSGLAPSSTVLETLGLDGVAPVSARCAAP